MAAVSVAVAAVPAAAQQGSQSFPDVASEAYYAQAVEALESRGVFEGTECAEGFCPHQPLPRWQMAVWLVRALEEAEPQATVSRFADVESDLWWMPYAERLAELEITVGCRSEPLSYCPDRPVSRAQMASFLARAFDLPAAEPAGFADVDSQTNVHGQNIDRLAASEITVGCRTEPLSYCPSRSVTRAQMAAFIHRSLQWLEDNRPTEISNTAPTPKLISNDTDDFITEENDFSRYIRDNVVAQYEDTQPWLGDVWNHTNRVDFAYALGDRHYTSTYYGIRRDEGDVINRWTAIAITANPDELSRGYNHAHVHELAHVYTKSNRIVADPAPIAAGHLYFSEITRGRCRPYELYAETAETLLFSRYATYNNWVACPEVPKKVTDEAIEVVRQAFSGQMPDWFYETFQDASGNLDYQAIWAAVGRIKDGGSRLAVVNQLRYSFGGYCFESRGEGSVPEDFLTGQPWVDGGC